MKFFPMLNKVLWSIAISSILVSSIYFSIHFSFLQFRFSKMIKSFRKKEEGNGVSAKESFFMVLAGRIGVGSIAGVALGIYFGGVGSLFWMWVTALLTSIHAYLEAILGSRYQEKDGEVFKGGPSYYMKHGLKNKTLGGIYAGVVMLTYLFGFLSIQANTITKSAGRVFSFSPSIVALLFLFFAALAIFGGVKKIASWMTKIVPFMTILYVGFGIFCMVKNIEMLPNIIRNIFVSAFHLTPFLSGFFSSLFIGIQRGVFSSEAGLGTGSIASSISKSDGVAQGYLQILGVYVTSFLICTSTAFILLTSNFKNLSVQDINGIELVFSAFSYHFGILGHFFLFLSILLFSFSTILTGYYYVESSFKYFFERTPKFLLFLLKLITLTVLSFGCIISSSFLWNFVDFMVAILAIINIYALIHLKDKV